MSAVVRGCSSGTPVQDPRCAARRGCWCGMARRRGSYPGLVGQASLGTNPCASCAAGPSALPPAVSTPSPSPSPSPSPAAPVPTNSAGSGTCDPPTGWEGHSCAICKTDAACMTVAYTGAGDLAATCSRDFRFANNSMLKNWSCDVDAGTILSDKIKNLVVQCRTGLQPGTELPAAAAPPALQPPAAEPPAAAATTSPPSAAAAAPPPAPAPSPNLEGTINDIIGALTPPPAAAAGGPAAGPAGPAGGGRRRVLLADTGLLDRTGEPLCSITFDAEVDGKASAVACTATE